MNAIRSVRLGVAALAFFLSIGSPAVAAPVKLICQIEHVSNIRAAANEGLKRFDPYEIIVWLDLLRKEATVEDPFSRAEVGGAKHAAVQIGGDGRVTLSWEAASKLNHNKLKSIVLYSASFPAGFKQVSMRLVAHSRIGRSASGFLQLASGPCRPMS